METEVDTYTEREKNGIKKIAQNGNLKLKNGTPETLLKIKAITHNPMKEHRGNQIVTTSHDEWNLQYKRQVLKSKEGFSK